MLQKRQVQNTSTHDWILLIHQLPPKPTNLRVRIWRKLQKLGAVAIKNSVYVLPANEKTNEDFQWLKQEIDSAGGEAAVFRAGSVEGATDDEIIGTFRNARDEEFAAITAEFDGLTGRIREQSRAKHLSPARLGAHETELDRLHGELERVIANDFFEAKGRAAALTAYDRSQKAIRRSQIPAKKAASGSRESGVLSIADFQNRRWVTRRNLHIDRLASAWLISQFIDKRPRFYFVGDDETIEAGIPFDMFGAEFTHQGEDCTFETLLKRFGLTDISGLRELAQIVHDIDLKDDKFNRLEAVGLNAIINGLSESLHDDRKLLQQCGAIFDGLFTLFGKQAGRKSHMEVNAYAYALERRRARNDRLTMNETATIEQASTLRGKVVDYLSLERNVSLASAAVFILGLGEELWKKFLPKYLEALGATPMRHTCTRMKKVCALLLP